MTQVSHIPQDWTDFRPISGRIYSLWDIMRLFDQTELVWCLVELSDIRETCRRISIVDGSGDTDLPDALWKSYQEAIPRIEQFAFRSGFMMAFESAQHLHFGLDPKHKQNVSTVQADISQLEALLRRDVEDCLFVKIAERFYVDVDNKALFGDDVQKAFPSAQRDLTEAGNCLGVECNTAAVFHFMRAVEWALRAFCAHLGFTHLKSRRRSGGTKLTPVSHSQWEQVLDALQGKVDRKIEKMRPGKRKQAAQEFYYPALQEIRAMRETRGGIMRCTLAANTVMRTRSLSKTTSSGYFGC